MKIITLNLNGIRSAARKGLFKWMTRTRADVVCVQELKAHDVDLDDIMRAPGKFRGHFYHAEKKGYSGVGLNSPCAPDRVTQGIGNREADCEGRYVRADFGKLSVISVYLPSGSAGALCDAMVALAADSGLRSRLGAAAQQAVDICRADQDVAEWTKAVFGPRAS